MSILGNTFYHTDLWTIGMQILLFLTATTQEASTIKTGIYCEISIYNGKKIYWQNQSTHFHEEISVYSFDDNCDQKPDLLKELPSYKLLFY